LYGTTIGGGANSAGTIFKIAPDGSGFALAHSFLTVDSPALNNGQLLVASDGNLYGVTTVAAQTIPGPLPLGSVFQLTPTGVFTRIFTFDVDLTPSSSPFGARPIAGIVQGSDGNLYGTTECGINICTPVGGTVFKLAAGLPSTTPTVSISLSNPSISLGNSATLTWTSSNVTACAASDAWTGSRPTSGTQTVTPTAVGTFTYTLVCSGSGGSANGSATLTVTVTSGGGGSGGGGGGGCVMTSGGAFDPLFALLILFALTSLRYTRNDIKSGRGWRILCN
jgi:uncharacterized repeat protein (TIGR03803 family)